MQFDWTKVSRKEPLGPYTTLKAGGSAEFFTVAKSHDQIVRVIGAAQSEGLDVTTLGWGSNVLPSDAGVPGLVVINAARCIEIDNDGSLLADAGAGFQEVFLKAAQKGFGGLEFAVGIPGTLGGALVSNAGAYRSNVSEFLTRLEIVENGEPQWVDPSWMEFSYRDSVLRRPNPPKAVVTKVEMRLPVKSAKDIFDEAREYQRQRISKQPPPASAGSFFKNVVDAELAQRIAGLTEGMKKAGVVPSGFLIEACGLKGFRLGGAMVGKKHANFLLNVNEATATEIRSLAHHVRSTVFDQFRVWLEEEVLYLGDWSAFSPIKG